MKKFFTVLAILVTLFAVSMFAVPYFFKARIIALVTEQANQNIDGKIQLGDIRLTLFRDFPNFSLIIEEIQLKNNPPFDEMALAKVEEMVVSLDLLSVFSGDKIQIKKIHLITPSIHVSVLENGIANYNIALEGEPEIEDEIQEKPKGNESDFSILLQEYAIENAAVIYDDKAENVHLSIKGLNHAGTGDFTATNFNLDTKTNIESFTFNFDGIQYMSNLSIGLNAILGIDTERMFFTVKENSLTLNTLHIALDGNVELKEEDMLLNLSLRAQESNLKSLLSLIPVVFTEGVEKLYANGELDLSGKVNGVYNDNTYPAFSLDVAMQNGSVKYPDLPSSINNIQLKANVTSTGGSDLDNTVIDVANFHLDIANNPIDLYLHVTTPITDPEIDSKLYTTIKFEELQKAIPLEEYNMMGKLESNVLFKGRMSDLEMENYDQFNASGKLLLDQFSVSGNAIPHKINIPNATLNFTPRYVHLSNLDVKTEGLEGSMNGKVENYLEYILGDGILKGEMSFYGKNINVNPFLQDDEYTAETTENTVLPEIDDKPDYEPLIPSNIDFTFNAQVEELLYDNIQMTDFNGVVSVKNNTLIIEKAGLQALGGYIGLKGMLQTAEKKPIYNFDFDVKSLKIQETANKIEAVSKYAPIAKWAKGNFNSNFKVKGKMDEEFNPILPEIAASGLVQTMAVSINEFKPFNALGEKLKMNSLKSQKISDTQLFFELLDGKVFVKPFEAKIGDMKTKITGSTTLDQTIDYVFNMEVPKNKLPQSAMGTLTDLSKRANQVGFDVLQGENIFLDVFMTNTVSDPKIRLGLNKKGADVAKEAQKKLEEEFAKRKKEAEEKARAEMEKKKKELEEKARAEAEKAKQNAKRKLENEAKKKLKGLFGNP